MSHPYRFSQDDRPSNPPSGQRLPRKVLIVDNFDNIPGIDEPTIDGHHVRVSQNYLSTTGWKLPTAHRKHFPLHSIPSKEGAISKLVPTGQRIFLPAKDIKKLDDSQGGKTLGRNVHDSGYEKANIFVAEDSIWTVNPYEPLLEETPYQYNYNRKMFLGILALVCAIGLIIFACTYTFVFKFGGGVKYNNSNSTLSNKTLQTKDHTHKLSNIHALVMTSTVFVLQGFSILIYRIFPHVSKFKLKIFHAILGILGIIGCIVGTLISIYSHQINSLKSFYSLHGFIGIALLFCMMIQWIGGFSALLLPFISLRLKAKFIPIHKFFGGTVFLLTIPAMATGIVVHTKLFIPLKVHSKLPPKSWVLNSAGVFTIIYSVLVTFLLSDYRFRRRPQPEIRLAKEQEPERESIQEDPNSTLVYGNMNSSTLVKNSGDNN